MPVEPQDLWFEILGLAVTLPPRHQGQQGHFCSHLREDLWTTLWQSSGLALVDPACLSFFCSGKRAISLPYLSFLLLEAPSAPGSAEFLQPLLSESH